MSRYARLRLLVIAVCALSVAAAAINPIAAVVPAVILVALLVGAAGSWVARGH